MVLYQTKFIPGTERRVTGMEWSEQWKGGQEEPEAGGEYACATL